jgi:hypothetical protein
MRYLFTCILIILALAGQAQKYLGKQPKGYGQIGFTVYGNDELSIRPGISVGAGVMLGNNITTGAGFDLFMFNKNKLRFSQGYADFRAFFKGLDVAGPYIAFQPGVVLVKTEANSKSRSGFSANILGGFFVKVKRNFGVMGAVGYGLLTYQFNGIEKRQHGIKFNTSIFF